MAARAMVSYDMLCEMNECQWQLKREGTSNWEKFPQADHEAIETAHVLKEPNVRIRSRGGYSSYNTIDLRQRRFNAGYGSRYEVNE